MFKLKELNVDGYERVVRAIDETTNLDVTIAVHNTKLGPALGGIRYWQYDSIQSQFTEAKRLSEAMTLKNSLCGINKGGGKAVINNKGIEKTPDLYRSLGEVVQHLGGIYIAAGDVGTTTQDLEYVAETTEFVSGIKFDSSAPTALGVFDAIKAWSIHKLGNSAVGYLQIAISGLGKVGYKLAVHLYDEGHELTVAEIDSQKVDLLLEELDEDGYVDIAEVSPKEIHTIDCDVFSPCALGNAINIENRKNLGCQAIIGSANNQLDNLGTNSWLFHNGIDYVPDYLANAGGVIAIDHEIRGTTDYFDIVKDVEFIGKRTKEICERSDSEKRSMETIAQCMAWERINSV